MGAALNGGVFLAFSVLTMPGLCRLAVGDPRSAVTAIQGMNEVAVRPLFMVVFFGTSLVALALGVLGAVRLSTASGWLSLAGAVVFVLGATVLTAVHHVPLNDALATVGPADDPARAWAAFAPSWIVGNHVRAAAGVISATLFVVAGRIN